MTSYGTPPTIPDSLQIYNSYVEDPKWQIKFTAIWASCVGAAVLVSLPHLARAIRSRRAFSGLFGVWDDWNYQPLTVSGEGNTEKHAERSGRRLAGMLRTVASVLLWTPMGTGLDLGQIILVAAYIIIVIVCIVTNAPLIDNPNRAGFLALAQLPVVFLFATKNSLLSLVLGPGNGYEKLNYVHRWSGRGLFLGAVIHGSLWIRNHLQYDLPILSQQKEGSGVAAFSILCVLVLGSIRPIRVYFYQWFWVVHVLMYVAFFITICYHTTYASPWILPPLGFYALDLLMRMLRYRIKNATLVPTGEQMTLINVHDCTSGWVAGQHVRLHIFFGDRFFESHPLTIACAPPSTSCLQSSSQSPNMLFGVRAKGDWTRALHSYASNEQARLAASLAAKRGEKVGEDIDAEVPGAPVQVMIDGPYGGCSLDLGRYESVLLVAGGSGATFTLGLLDDIVGRVVKLGRKGGEKTRRIEFAWCIRSFGCIEWFAPMLLEIANVAATCPTLDLHVTVFVTCLCNPEAVPPIPNSAVLIEKPSVHRLLHRLITPPSSSSPSKSSPSAPLSDSANAKLGTACPCNCSPDAATCCCDVINADISPSSSQDAIKEVPVPVLNSKSSSTSSDEKVDLEQFELEQQSRGDGLQWVGEGGGVAVCASGPERLTRDASNTVARMSVRYGVRMGGIALHTEAFTM